MKPTETDAPTVPDITKTPRTSTPKEAADALDSILTAMRAKARLKTEETPNNVQ